MFMDTFQAILLLTFGASTLVFGTFATYFGAGRSRRIGMGLGLLGLLSLVFFTGFTFSLVPALDRIASWNLQHVQQGVVAVLAALIGGGASLLLFLASIMRA